MRVNCFGKEAAVNKKTATSADKKILMQMVCTNKVAQYFGCASEVQRLMSTV